MSSNHHSRSGEPESSSPGSLPESAVNVYAPSSDTFSPADYAIGEVISGRFRVEHVIGVGSMGVVLAARHLELDERVAIKFIRAEAQQMPGVLSRFAREAKAAVSIKSEHVAQVFDVGTAEGIGPYIVMEYLEGQDLGAYLEECGPLSIRQAVHYVMQACEALAVAHSAGITHRDIKPENLFLTRQGDRELIKLLDFGISKAALTGRVFGDELSAKETSCLLGTPLYMSPEQIRSTSEVDHRSDIWSLGAVLYELVSARSAFSADSVREVLTRILEGSPQPLAAHLQGVPASLQAVIDRCLEKDPNRRFQNVAELAIALLPFAPSRARLYAQRASSILGNASDSIIPAPMPSAPAGMRTSIPFSAEAEIVPTAIVSLPDISAPPVSGQRGTSQLVGKSPPVAALAAAAALLVLMGVVWSTLREDAASPVGAAQLPSTGWQSGDLGSGETDGVEPGSTPVAAGSRRTLIESDPSAARVEIDGRLLGVTPLSTELPLGSVELHLARDGYESRTARLEVKAGEPGEPLLRRFSLTRAKSARSEQEPRGNKPRSAARYRPAPPAPPRAVRPQITAPTREVEPEPKPRVEPEPARLIEPDRRARLLDERRPARLLD